MRRISVALAVLAVLASSAATSNLLAQTSPSTYVLDAADSKIYVVTRRSGVFSFFGHDHAILAGEWSGTLCLTPEAPHSGSGQIVVAASSLVIDAPGARKTAGLGRGPSRDQVRTLQAKLLDAKHLAAAQYPHLTFEITRISQSSDADLMVEGRLIIRDHAEELHFPIDMVEEGGGLRFRGRVDVRQSSFGIRPESIAGVVRVADTVEIYVDLLAVSSGTPCR